MTQLEIKDLHVSIDNKEIIKGLNFSTKQGEVHALMGPNGSGKSTLAYTLLGHPKYTITAGDILIEGESLLEMSTDERARKGLFLGFQYPTEISGVGYSNFLRSAYNSLSKAPGQENREVFLTVKEFHNYIKKNLDLVGLDSSFLARYLNEGFSGGEKKRSEVMQMLVLKPKFAILDEPDSGLDIDAIKSVAESINQLVNPESGIVVITHYARILRYIKKLDYVHVISNGRIVKSGTRALADMLEEKGYKWIDGQEEKN